MFKKTVLIGLTGLILASGVSAVNINLPAFQSDFQALIQGIGEDLAPSLRLGALAGDVQGDASIDHFSVDLGLGVNTTNGLGTILRPGAYVWQFQALPLDNLVNDNASSTFFEHLMAYPSAKVAFGFALGSWDFTVSGSYLPQVGVSSVSKTNPQFSFGNFGVQVRKTLIHDPQTLNWVPGLSLGTSYHVTFFNFTSHITSLSDLGIGTQSLGGGQNLDINGTFGFHTFSQVATIDLHLSKRIAFVTPYVKFSGAYQNSTFTGDTNLNAVVTGGTTSQSENIVANPVVNISDFAFLANPGLEIDIGPVVFNINADIDVGRANLSISRWDLNGINANAIAINTGIRFTF